MRGQFKLPEDCQLISVIYWISCTKMFLKPVAVSIQHCAVISNKEDSKKMKFLIAKCSQGPPYRFVEKKGVFNAEKQYATIQLKRFSIIGAGALNDTEKFYAALKFYKPVPHSVNMSFRFVVLTRRIVKIKEV